MLGYAEQPSYTVGSTCVTNLETDTCCEAVDTCEVPVNLSRSVESIQELAYDCQAALWWGPACN